ncbi:MAG: hypothetical protein ACI92N_000360 [Pseudomonadales bacterium]|jgi:hypothetical protein
MIEQLSVVSAFLGMAAMIIGVLSMIFTITIAFPKIREVESMIASPGKYLDMTRAVWGGGPWARWIRSMTVWSFFVYRHLPVIGENIEARMGVEEKPTPRTLKLWALLPVSITLSSAVVFASAATYLMIFE